MNPLTLSPHNYNAIKSFAAGQTSAGLQGSKLEAFYSLIQKIGESVQTTDPALNGLKCIRISDKEHVAIKRTGSKEKFYPCVLKSIIMSEL